MSTEMPKPYDNPTPCESEKSYQEGWNDAATQAQEYVDELTKQRNRFRFVWNNARSRAQTLAEDVALLDKQNRDLARSLDEVIGERDYAQSMADKLAAAIAPEDVLGEHSDGNFPWQNALDWAAEKERTFEALRKELADTAMMRDFYQRSADHIATNRAVAEAAIAKWERGDLPAYEALQAIKQALTTTTSEECPR